MRFQSREQVCEVLADETLVFTWVGILGPADVASLFDEVRTHFPRWAGRILWDMSNTQLLPGETRQLLLARLVQMPPTATAVVTSEFFVRVPVTMLLEVVATEVAAKPPYRFFDTSEDAMSWLTGRTSEVA